MQEEIWKDIPDYEGLYQVSNIGNVKSLPRRINNGKSFYISKEKILKPATDKQGYLNFALCVNSVLKSYKAHQLVAMAFLGHKRCGLKLVVDHINDVKNDNRVENLQIVTNRFNVRKTQGDASSNYKGVYWSKTARKWVAQIKINGKQYNLGHFVNEIDAHNMYQLKLSEL
jgi:hypothetical protein